MHVHVFVHVLRRHDAGGKRAVPFEDGAGGGAAQAAGRVLLCRVVSCRVVTLLKVNGAAPCHTQSPISHLTGALLRASKISVKVVVVVVVVSETE